MVSEVLFYFILCRKFIDKPSLDLRHGGRVPHQLSQNAIELLSKKHERMYVSEAHVSYRT